jgi:hypothetical protein
MTLPWIENTADPAVYNHSDSPSSALAMRLATDALKQGLAVHETVRAGYVNPEDLPAFLDAMGQGKQLYSVCHHPPNQPDKCWVWDHGVLFIDINASGRSGRQEHRATCSIYTTVEQELWDLLEIQEKFAKKDSRPKARALVAVKSQNGFQLLSAGQAGSPLVRGNYTPATVEAFDHIVSELALSNPRCGGRLSILTGPPGTGKTYLLEGLMDAYPWARYVIFPPSLISELTAPDMLRILLPDDDGDDPFIYRRSRISNKDDHYSPLVLLIEDADQALVARMADNLPAISTLLNLADGILGRCLDVRIIATSNAKVSDVDKALIRPGRICPPSGIVHVPALSPEQANEVLERPSFHYTGPAITKPTTLADLYRLVNAAPKGE